MIVMGIDPGFSITGFGILKKEGNRAFLLDYGFLKMSSQQSLPERVTLFHNFVSDKCLSHTVTHIAIETPFLGKNAQNFLKLGYLRGIIYLISHQKCLQLHEFSPREVKAALTGFGGADKEQVARVIYTLFPALKTQAKADVTDALAVTLCGFWHRPKA